MKKYRPGRLIGCGDDRVHGLAGDRLRERESRLDQMLAGGKKIVTFMDRRIDEMPRDELEQHFVDAWDEIERLKSQIAEQSISHIHDLAAIARRRSITAALGSSKIQSP